MLYMLTCTFISFFYWYNNVQIIRAFFIYYEVFPIRNYLHVLILCMKNNIRSVCQCLWKVPFQLDYHSGRMYHCIPRGILFGCSAISIISFTLDSDTMPLFCSFCSVPIIERTGNKKWESIMFEFMYVMPQFLLKRKTISITHKKRKLRFVVPRFCVCVKHGNNLLCFMCLCAQLQRK